MSRRFFLYSIPFALHVCFISNRHSHSQFQFRSASISLIRYLFALSTIRIGFRDNFQYLHRLPKVNRNDSSLCSLSCYFHSLNEHSCVCSSFSFSSSSPSSSPLVSFLFPSVSRENANKIDKIRIARNVSTNQL